MSDNKQEQMKKTKAGDRIRVTKERRGMGVGEVVTVKKVESMDGYTSVRVDLLAHHNFELFSDKDAWEPAEKTLATLQEGDAVMIDDCQRTVLGVIRPGLYVMSQLGHSDEDGQDRSGDNYTAKDLEKHGYTVKQDAPTIVEKTVADLEQELKLPAGSLRIKKDAA